MLIAVLLSLAVSFPQSGANAPKPGAGQERNGKQDTRPKRGDVVEARGCLKGSALENASLEDRLAEPHTFRLTGEKKKLEEIRKEHDHHADIVTGELRTDLPTSPGTPGKTIGNTRIVVGAGPSRPMMPGPPPPLPVLKVTSFEHTGVSCR